jgi:hypothetical protein
MISFIFQTIKIEIFLLYEFSRLPDRFNSGLASFEENNQVPIWSFAL